MFYCGFMHFAKFIFFLHFCLKSNEMSSLWNCVSTVALKFTCFELWTYQVMCTSIILNCQIMISLNWVLYIINFAWICNWQLALYFVYALQVITMISFCLHWPLYAMLIIAFAWRKYSCCICSNRYLHTWKLSVLILKICMLYFYRLVIAIILTEYPDWASWLLPLSLVWSCLQSSKQSESSCAIWMWRSKETATVQRLWQEIYSSRVCARALPETTPTY